MKYKTIFFSVLVSCLFFSSSALAGLGPTYELEGMVKRVDGVNKIVSLSVSCDKYGEYMAVCKEDALKKQRILSVIDKMIQSMQGKPVVSLLEKISNYFKVGMYYDIDLDVRESNAEEYADIPLSAIKVGNIVRAETHDVSQRRGEIIEENVQRDYLGVALSLSGNVLTVEGDYYREFLIDDASFIGSNGINFTGVKDINFGKDILLIVGEKQNDGRIKADSIEKVGIASEENEQKDVMCKPGVAQVMNYKSGEDLKFYCAKCGDGVCSGVETIGNCFNDCSESNSDYSEQLLFTGCDYDAVSGVFHGTTFSDIIRFVRDKNTQMILKSSDCDVDDGTCHFPEEILKESEINFKEFISGEMNFPRTVTGKVITMKDGIKAVKVDSVSVFAQ